MSDDERVPIVGGPLDGQTYPWCWHGRLAVPDRDGSRRVIADDGHAVTLYRWHTYELESRVVKGELVCRWNYRGRVDPCAPPDETPPLEAPELTPDAAAALREEWEELHKGPGPDVEIVRRQTEGGDAMHSY